MLNGTTPNYLKEFKPLTVDLENLTIEGVQFPDIESLENCASGIGSNMYEGFEPDKTDIEIIRDGYLGKLTIEEVVQKTLEKYNGNYILDSANS